MDWFLYDTDLRYQRVMKIENIASFFSSSSLNPLKKEPKERNGWYSFIKAAIEHWANTTLTNSTKSKIFSITYLNVKCPTWIENILKLVSLWSKFYSKGVNVGNSLDLEKMRGFTVSHSQLPTIY